MNTVYLVSYYERDGSKVNFGVCSSKEKAEEVIQKFMNHGQEQEKYRHNYSIQIFTVDNFTGI